MRDILQLIDRFTLAIFVIITNASLSIKAQNEIQIRKPYAAEMGSIYNLGYKIFMGYYKFQALKFCMPREGNR